VERRVSSRLSQSQLDGNVAARKEEEGEEEEEEEEEEGLVRVIRFSTLHFQAPAHTHAHMPISFPITTASSWLDLSMASAGMGSSPE
jgi:hypothetical protein